MARSKTYASHVRMIENGDELGVLVPVRRDWFLLVFLSLVVVVFAKALVEMALGKAKPPLSMLFLLCYGSYALALWFWHVAGIEEITANTDAFSIRHSAFGMGATREFEPHKMCDLRVSPSHIPLSTWEAIRYFLLRRDIGYRRFSWNSWGGPLAFDYGDKTYHFGAGLTETEARELLPHLLRRLSPNDPR